MTSATQATLQRIFAEVLDVDQVSPHDGFFDIGGDSVLALRVVARAREAGLSLTVRDVFNHQTAQTLAAVTGEVLADSAAPAAEPPLISFSADDFDDFEDSETGQRAGDGDMGWETVR
jgi:aryl carrier-like protein